MRAGAEPAQEGGRGRGLHDRLDQGRVCQAREAAQAQSRPRPRQQPQGHIAAALGRNPEALLLPAGRDRELAQQRRGARQNRGHDIEAGRV